jgi:hypothetical protein
VPLDAEFSLVRRRHADAALGWATSSLTVPGPLDFMTLGEFEPQLWVPARARTGERGVIGLADLAGMDVVHGPRRSSPATYDAWLQVLRSVRPRFGFTDPPLRHSLPLALAFASSADRLTAVLTGPLRATNSGPAGSRAAQDGREETAQTRGMVRVRLDQCQLTATAAVAWSTDLPRHLQQVLFDTADTVDLTTAC